LHLLAWLAEAAGVAKGLNILVTQKRRGVRRSNEYRDSLIGGQISAICKEVYGKEFTNTMGGWATQFAPETQAARMMTGWMAHDLHMTLRASLWYGSRQGPPRDT
jgi:hypothetical protein